MSRVETTELLEGWLPSEGALVEWAALRESLLALRRGPVCVREPELWFSTRPADRDAAVEACLSCPAGDACRAYAAAADERHGVWGASTEVERRTAAGRSR